MNSDRYKPAPEGGNKQTQELASSQGTTILLDTKAQEQRRIANITDKTKLVLESQKLAASAVLQQSQGIEMVEAKFDKTEKETKKAQKVIETIKKEAVEETSGLAGQAKILGVLLIVILVLWVFTRN